MAYRHYMSGVKARLGRREEVRIHIIDYRTPGRVCRGPEEVWIGPATRVCWEGGATWTCNEYTIMVRICRAGDGLGSEASVFSICSCPTGLSTQKLACLWVFDTPGSKTILSVSRGSRHSQTRGAYPYLTYISPSSGVLRVQ